MPSTVHSSIRWSARHPWLESEHVSLDDRLAKLSQMKEKKTRSQKSASAVRKDLNDSAGKPSAETPNSVSELGNRKPSTQKRRRSSRMSCIVSASATHVSSKRKLLPSSNTLTRTHYAAPIGMRWSENSCAYDSVFTPVFLQWCANREFLSDEIGKSGSLVAIQLIEGFACYEAGLESLEEARDTVRRAMASIPQSGCPYGAYTLIENVCSVLFEMKYIVLKWFYECPNGHHGLHGNGYNALLSLEIVSFTSIAHWMLSRAELSSMHCPVCRHFASVHLKFCMSPPLFAFEFSARPNLVLDHIFTVQIENRVVTYTLAAIIYYSQYHFTTQIITKDGQVWFYDGMSIADPTVNPTLEYITSINNPSFTVQM